MSGERGAATLTAVAAIAVLLAVTGGMAQVGAVVVARHRAQAAADLAALAAAGQVADGVESACAQATSIAQAMSAAVTDCTVEGLEAVVTVDAAPGLGAWRFGNARAGARAGPVSVR